MSKSKPRIKKRTRAERADRHDLYQRSVQSVDTEIDFVDEAHRELRGTNATRLREDFCGTFNTSCEWIRRRPTNRAVGVDLCQETLAWGIQNNLSRLPPNARNRMEIIHGDVRETRGRPRNFDVILAMNFSYWCLRERTDMLAYFNAVHRSLTTRGLFMLDFYGGPDSMRETRERRGCRGFTYIWDQKRYHPVSGYLDCRIHYAFPDGSRMRNAFIYHWRLWTIPELRDLLLEAGFERLTVYWEGDDGKGGGDGIFEPNSKGEACPAYIAYLVAEKTAIGPDPATGR